MGDHLMVDYDRNDIDIPSLTVYRESDGRVAVVSQIQGDTASLIYYLLTDMAILNNNKTIDEVLFQLKCIKEHLKFIYQTTEKSIDFDIQVLNTCISMLEDCMVKK